MGRHLDATGRDPASASPPDLILRGLVITMDPSRVRAEAVAVTRGRVAGVGRWNEIRALAGPGTEILDLASRTILPGFQDAHVHPPQGGLERMRCDLNDLSSRDAYVEAISGYSAAHPEEPWVLGGGWAMEHFPGGTPDRATLDAAVPDRPAFLVNRDGHGAWVNSRALEFAGIDAGTPDPPDGRIERDTAGEPAGMLHEGAMALVERMLPPVGPQQWRRAVLLAQEYLHGLGVTAWQDAWVLPETLAAYGELADSGELTARVVAALWWERDRGEEQVADLLELRGSGPVGRLRASSVKIMQDGIVENFTAGMIEPYLDGHGQGLSFVDPAELNRHVTRLDREGFQVHVHAIGDRAVREALDAFEAAIAVNGPSSNRHHIAHPLRQIQVALTRVPFARPDREPFLPDQRLDLETALRAFTMGSAWVNNLDAETGSIEPGKLADLAVVDADLPALAPHEVGTAKVVLT